MSLGKYVFNLLYLLDKAGNTLTGGSPDETISRRAARSRARQRDRKSVV